MRPLAGKRIGLLSAWASRANGGVFEAVVAQVEMLRGMGAVPIVLAVGDPAHSEDRWRFGDTEICVSAGGGPAQFAYAPGMPAALDNARLDLLHLHGIWQYPSHAAGRWAQRTGKPLVISPHGMLDRWITRRNAWKKLAARKAWEQRSWSSAAGFHALTQTEAADIDHWVPHARSAIIPNAAPQPAPPPERLPPPNLLYLGRIHEKKNIAALIAAWQAVGDRLPDGATLTIAGWGDDEGITMLERAMMPADPSIQFVGTAFGAQKAALFDVSRFLALPSLSEGLPMAVLEAWASGTPTIISEGCNLPEGFAAGAAIRCGTDRTAIANALIEGFASSERRWLDMAHKAQSLAAGPFSHSTVAAQWERFYSALI